MYQHPTYHHHQERKVGIFLPFLSIIIIGLIVVLVFQIVDYFQEKHQQALQNKAAVDVVTGRAEMKVWGLDQWTSAIDGSLLNEGDIIRTAPGSRVVLSLLNSSIVRINASTEVELIALKSKDGQDEASFALKQGQIWLKRAPQQEVMALFKVVTDHLEINSLGTIFEVSRDNKETVHVLDGKVNVAVKVQDSESGKIRTAETLEVALGQEVSIGQSDVLALQNKKSLALLALLSDEFRLSEWYSWNRSQDLSGASTMTVVDAVKKQEEETSQAIASEPAVEVTSVLSAPQILIPKEDERTTKTNNVLISGIVSSATEKLEVTTYVGGKAEAYILQKYKPGSEKWTYVASTTYGNFVPGVNKYTITAIGKEGKRSDPAEITLIYDKPKEPADLSAPSVQSSETTEDAVKVEGKIGKGIVKVFVNNFALTQYVPDSGVWMYFAKTAYGNLKEGENAYEAYGIDTEGNKTPVTKFTITKKPKPVEQPAPQPAGEPVL